MAEMDKYEKAYKEIQERFRKMLLRRVEGYETPNKKYLCDTYPNTYSNVKFIGIHQPVEVSHNDKKEKRVQEMNEQFKKCIYTKVSLLDCIQIDENKKQKITNMMRIV